jgi:hypothetical protein|tara:strand:- start:496 stop:1368 length:873 start_codon:yes stop_codon:yes gene_type:complete
MEFIQELHEARLTRQASGLKTLTYTDCCERAYLTMLIMEVLRRFPNTAPYAHGYAKKTSGYDNYKHFRMSGTDLYNFVYFIVGDEDALDKLKDPGAAKTLRKRTYFPTMAFNRYVQTMKTGAVSEASTQQLFINVEGALRITNQDYKNIRRNLFSFNQISAQSRKLSITRLLLAARAKLRNSDIIQYLEELSAERDLEVYKVQDPEPKVSVTDIDVTGKDLLGYRYLVGSKNIMLTKKFLELAKNNKSVPANILQAYMPAIVMIDNIVKAGPGFVQMLRTLENRAKNTPK